MTTEKNSIQARLINRFNAENQLQRHLCDRVQSILEQEKLDKQDSLSLILFALDICGEKKIIKQLRKQDLGKSELEILQLAKLKANPEYLDSSINKEAKLHDAQLTLLIDQHLLELAKHLELKDQYQLIVKIWSILNIHQFSQESDNLKNEAERKKILKALETERDFLTEQMGDQKDKKEPSRGIETMFRTTSKSHLELSAMADNKANILLSISAILISLILSTLASKIDSNPKLLLPTIIILIVALITVIFATIATIPNVTTFDFRREDIEAKKGNLLFFGNFSKMTLEDYEFGMKFLMRDRDYLYNSMIRDIYFLGKVLDKKYRNLKIAYYVFMYGLVLSTLAFVISFL
ncbi:MAG: hypothetical protein KDD94_00830 [Calditrichaeota bacterium]|nr:hypothetical protein [Calditrichota bacterium]